MLATTTGGGRYLPANQLQITHGNQRRVDARNHRKSIIGRDTGNIVAANLFRSRPLYHSHRPRRHEVVTDFG